MNILQVIRFTFSPNSFQEDDPEEYSNVKEALADEETRNKYFYNKEENLNTILSSEEELSLLANKDWQKFRNENLYMQNSANNHQPVKLYMILRKVAAAILFILNPWMLYKLFQKSITEESIIQTTSEVILFSAESLHQWKDLPLEINILLFVSPVPLFLLLFFLLPKWGKSYVTPLVYLSTSLFIGLIWAYYSLTGSDSVLPFFASISIASLGIIFYMFKKTY